MKITTVGAGSLVWGPTINVDCLLNPALDGAKLMLMDVDAAALAAVKTLLERLVAERGLRKTIAATTDLTEALRDADHVIAAISVGGDRLWRYDAIFPQIYGIFQPVGDTIGPGGLARALRHAPALLRIGRTMLAVARPGAPLIQLSNPMNPLCAALGRLDGLPVYGVCHGVQDTERLFAERLGLPREAVRIEAAGNNHHIYCSHVVVKDEVYPQERFAELLPRVVDGPFREEVWRRYGGLVGNHPRHPIEFLPGFLTAESGFGRAWEVPPLAVEIDPLRGERHDRPRRLFDAAAAQRAPLAHRPDGAGGGLSVDGAGQVAVGRSREGIDLLIAALAHGEEHAVHLNLPNEGAIVGIDPAYNVELPVTLRRGTPVRAPVRFNDAITRQIDRVGKEQHLLATACLDADEEPLIESLSLDALVPSREIATRLVREMLGFQREYLPAGLCAA